MALKREISRERSEWNTTPAGWFVTSRVLQTGCCSPGSAAVKEVNKSRVAYLHGLAGSTSLLVENRD